jgi:hypothetical protein
MANSRQRRSQKHVVPPLPMSWEHPVELLIQQFSDPFSFVRETITNSILAGSPRVEVKCLYQEPDCEILIEDWGPGIPLEVVTQRIIPVTRGEWDFRNSDGTGLGFISCFALAPQRVVLESCNYRVEFGYHRPEIASEITLLEQARRGTLIRWSKSLNPEDFPAYQEAVQRTIRCWFHYPKAEILLNGEDIRDRHLIQHPYTCRLQRPGLVLDVCPSFDERPYRGFLRDGMVLFEGNLRDDLPGVAFRADCSDLRPTFTRDGVLHDKAYEKTLREVRRLVERELLPMLTKAGGDALNYLAFYPDRCKLPLHSGGFIKMRQLNWTYNLWDGVYWDDQLSEQAQALINRGIPVLRGLEPWMQLLLERHQIYHASTSPPPADPGAWEKVFRLYAKLAWR